jgi:hypothetical protein
MATGLYPPVEPDAGAGATPAAPVGVAAGAETELVVGAGLVVEAAAGALGATDWPLVAGPPVGGVEVGVVAGMVGVAADVWPVPVPEGLEALAGATAVSAAAAAA